MLPISLKDFFVHETTFDRLLKYSIPERDKFPISNKDLVIREVTIHRLLCTRLREGSKLLTPRRNSSSSRQKFVEYHSTRPLKSQNLHHSQRQSIIDYYSTRTTSPLPTKELLVHETTNKYRPSTQKKVLYIRMLKVLQWTHVHTKAKRILQ